MKVELGDFYKEYLRQREDFHPKVQEECPNRSQVFVQREDLLAEDLASPQKNLPNMTHPQECFLPRRSTSHSQKIEEAEKKGAAKASKELKQLLELNF
jgi:hypothetical protein